MKFDIVQSLKNLLGIDPDSKLEFWIDNIGSIAPYIGSAITTHRINRLKKHLEGYGQRLVIIEEKLIHKDDKFVQFLQEKVFPFILEDMMNEAQDEKIEFLINGFENIINREFTDQDKIIAYCDVLRQLRIDELKRLITYTQEYKRLGLSNIKHLHPNATKEEYEEYYENKAYARYIDNRLINLGLIEIELSAKGSTWGDLSKVTNPSNASKRITSFGLRLIRFFDLTSRIKEIS